MTVKKITASDDLLLGAFGVNNTLSFRVSGASILNNIQVNTSNQMLMTANNVNWLKSDGTTCSVYSDLSVFTNTASATKRLTIESQGTSGAPYLTLKARNTTQGSMYLTNASLYVASETAATPITFQVNNAGTTTQSIQYCLNKGVVLI